MSSKQNMYAGGHLLALALAKAIRDCHTCDNCGHVPQIRDSFCGNCGQFNRDVIVQKLDAIAELLEFPENIPADWSETKFLAEELTEEEKREMREFVFPNTGIYIYHHSLEGYKIGKAENVLRRMEKHLCSAPSLELLHVIETSNLDWCERFLHNRFNHRRIHSKHEYFALTREDLKWIFSIKVLEPPRTLNNQLSLLDLL